jgi:hypothetical protein
MTCAELKEQTIDFLYGELDEEARRGFDLHLATCDDCRREVESLGGTLGRARVALAAGDEAVPASVKAASEKLVQLVVARRGRPFRTLGAPVIPEDAGGLWRLLRRPWFFPAFAAVSVISLFFLAQEAIVHRAMPLTPSEVAPAEPGEPAAPSESPVAPGAAVDKATGAPAGPVIEPLPPRAGAAPPAREEPPAAADRRAGSPESSLGGLHDDSQAAAPERRYATPPPPAPRNLPVNPFVAPMDNANADGVGAGRPAVVAPSAVRAQRPEPSAAPGASPNQPMDPWRAREVSRPAPGTYRAEGASAGGTSLPRGNFANEVVQPFTADLPGKAAAKAAAPMAASSSPPRPARSLAPQAAAKKREAESDLAETASEPEAVAPAAAAPSPAPASGAANESAAKRTPENSEDSLRALTTLGDRLVAEKRWAQVVVVYRSLIARYPKNPDLPAWKRRLELATQLQAEPSTEPQ